MATQKLNLTRDQLATFLKNHELIKQFEKLIQVVDEVSPSSDTTGISIQAGNADAVANEALAQIIRLAQDSAINCGTADQKATQALDALNRIANALEMVATAPVTREDNSLATDYVDVSTVAPTAVGGVPGRLKWNDTDGTLDLGLKGGNVTLQVGQENVLRVKNGEATPLADGEAVYVSGASGANLLVKRALANSDTTSASTIGIVTEPITVNGQGFITTFGSVRGVNTSSFNEGDILYLSPTTAGQITNVKPTAPQHMVVVGYCTKKSAGNGEIFTKVDNGYEVDELHNVLITNPVLAGSLLIYDATVGVWKNARLTAGSNVAITNADGSITIAVAGSPPTGAAGGVLSGTYPNPGFAVDMATQSELDAHTGNTSNPHATTAAQVGADPTGTAAASMAAHLAAADPHPQYALDSDLAAYALKSGNLSQFASTTSAQLAGVISDETGSGALVFASSPTLTTPTIGTIKSAAVSTPPVFADSAGTAMGTLCRAWVRFNGATGAINASFNVASVTRIAAGIYDITFSSAMPDANFAIVGMPSAQGGVTLATMISGAPTSASGAQIYTSNYLGAQFDANPVSIAVFR